MMLCVLCGFFAAANFLTSSLLRAAGSPDANRRFCDISGNLIQLFYTPTSCCEAAFFVVILKAVYDGAKHNDSDGSAVTGSSERQQAEIDPI